MSHSYSHQTARGLVLRHRRHPTEHPRRLVSRTARWKEPTVAGICRWCYERTASPKTRWHLYCPNAYRVASGQHPDEIRHTLCEICGNEPDEIDHRLAKWSALTNISNVSAPRMWKDRDKSGCRRRGFTPSWHREHGRTYAWERLPTAEYGRLKTTHLPK